VTSFFLRTGVGICSFRQGLYSDAEIAFGEANLLNEHDGKTWGYIALLEIARKNFEVVKLAIKKSAELKLSDGNLWVEIAEKLLEGKRNHELESVEKVLSSLDKTLKIRETIASIAIARGNLNDGLASLEAILRDFSLEESEMQRIQAKVRQLQGELK
jgi:tetratricopeptide (TPR) repeat protein